MKSKIISIIPVYNGAEFIGRTLASVAAQTLKPDRVIVLDGGTVVAEGPTADLLSDERLMLAHGLERPHILRHLHPH